MERPSDLVRQTDAETSAQAFTFEELFAEQHERLYRAYHGFHSLDVFVVDVATGVAEQVTYGAWPAWLNNQP